MLRLPLLGTMIIYIAAVVSYLRFLLNAKVVDPSAMSCFAGKALAHHAASS